VARALEYLAQALEEAEAAAGGFTDGAIDRVLAIPPTKR
jgi:hypothetical protein